MTLSLIPESAPFTVEQRAWLNGFMAGWIGLEMNGRANEVPPASALASPPTPKAVPEDSDETFPWHDPNLTIVQRLELADGRPLERRLMAAMAQLDCGACGYVCQTYSEAIVAGDEKNLTLCSPGGKNTVKAIKQLLKESSSASGNGSVPTNGAAKAATIGQATRGSVYHRENPFRAKLISTRNLNKNGSAKHTAHVVIDLAGSGLTYRVGDALGVYPTNPPQDSPLGMRFERQYLLDVRREWRTEHTIPPTGRTRLYRSTWCRSHAQSGSAAWTDRTGKESDLRRRLH
jgi:sulfite reductase (NADPH) flavoprotein alpha-component